MKRTLTTLAVLSMASVASASTFTATPDVPSTATIVNSHDNGARMFTLDFGSEVNFSDDLTYTDTKLTSITLKTTMKSGGGYGDVKLAVYSLGTSKTDFTGYVGVSAQGTHDSSTKTLTFTFTTPLTFDLEGTYAFAFVKYNKTESQLTTVEPGKTLYDTAKSVCSDMPKYFDVYQGSTSTLSASSSLYVNQSWVDGATAVATYSFSGNAIPEPATATLGLLALAGVLARRRRHA